MRIAVVVGLVAAGLCASPAWTQGDGSNFDTLAILSGTCTRLVAAGHDTSSACFNKLSSMGYKDGRLLFQFLSGQDVVVAFSGDGASQTKLTPDEVSQPIDHVAVSHPGPKAEDPRDVKTTRLPAKGNCVYTNPYAGASTVTCTADAADGHYEARFVSDGKPPAVHHF